MKNFYKFVLTAMTSAALVGCGNSEVSDDGQIVIKFANYAVLEAGYDVFWEGVKENFEALHDNISIEWVSAPYNESINQVLNMAGGGDRVDLIFGEIDWIPVLEDSGLITAVENILSEEFIADLYPSMVAGCSVDGVQYGVPVYASPFLLYYNTDLFKQANIAAPPSTYAEMLVAAEALAKLTTADGNKVYAFGQTTASVPVSGASINAMLHNFGGHLLNADGTLNMDTEPLTETMEMIHLLDAKGYNPQNAKLKDLRNLFALGQLAMYYDQSWGFNGVQSINPAATEFTASAPPLAGGDGDGASLLQAHTIMLVDNQDAAVADAVRMLVEYIITEETLSDYLANQTPAYPSRISMENMDAIANHKILQGAAGSLNNLIITPFVPALSDINLELSALAQAVTVADKDIETSVDAFIENVSSMLE
ncbi:ABC transporter substrate-binding protein [Candidatus Epulonipiscium viviparus]|uniref:ABC transporter substrate-binding protein n=1 Tax=Candidatus Epulonipiscium viviparus TaxID=420336 RepID=UPI0027380F99|nr:ABC transporter substrate-binding protein [Candidatus Epulopiscium viviparus]